MKDKGIGTIAIIIVAVVAAGAVGGGVAATTMRREDSTPDNGYEGTDTETFSGTWESEDPQVDWSGEWQFTVDWEKGEITGFFQGDGSGDIAGSVSGGTITAEAEGGAAMGMVEWSGSFNGSGSELSGTWKSIETDWGTISGTWSGEKGELEQEEDNKVDNDTSITVSSIDTTWKGYESGSFEEGIRIRAQGLDTDSPDWRVDIIGENEVWIYNSGNQSLYFTEANDDTWTEVSGDLVEQYKDMWSGYVTETEGWASEYGQGTHDVPYTNETVTVDIKTDVEIEDSRFTPPSDAVVNTLSP